MSDAHAKPAAASRVTLAILTEPGQANSFGIIHGGVLLRLADECGALAALRHAGAAQITTAAIDSLSFLSPVRVGERLEVAAEVTAVGRTSIETYIELFAEPLALAGPRRVAAGYGLYVALDESGAPLTVPPLATETDADRARDEAARRRRQLRLAHRENLQRPASDSS